MYPGAVTVQGVLRRKTVLKEGKKPTVRTPHTFLFTHTIQPCMFIYPCALPMVIQEHIGNKCSLQNAGPQRLFNLLNISVSVCSFILIVILFLFLHFFRYFCSPCASCDIFILVLRLSYSDLARNKAGALYAVEIT